MFTYFTYRSFFFQVVLSIFFWAFLGDIFWDFSLLLFRIFGTFVCVCLIFLVQHMCELLYSYLCRHCLWIIDVFVYHHICATVLFSCYIFTVFFVAFVFVSLLYVYPHCIWGNILFSHQFSCVSVVIVSILYLCYHYFFVTIVFLSSMYLYHYCICVIVVFASSIYLCHSWYFFCLRSIWEGKVGLSGSCVIALFFVFDYFLLGIA